MVGSKGEKTQLSIKSVKLKKDSPDQRLRWTERCTNMLHAPEAHMQTYLYGTAKETEQMLLFARMITAHKKYKKFKLIHSP